MTLNHYDGLDAADMILADPHPELSPEDFYKHIDAELVEPRRMKQLLVWCAKRASSHSPPNKTGGDGNAHAMGMQALFLSLIIFPALSPATHLCSFFLALHRHFSFVSLQTPISLILFPFSSYHTGGYDEGATREGGAFQLVQAGKLHLLSMVQFSF